MGAAPRLSKDNTSKDRLTSSLLCSTLPRLKVGHNTVPREKPVPGNPLALCLEGFGKQELRYREDAVVHEVFRWTAQATSAKAHYPAGDPLPERPQAWLTLQGCMSSSLQERLHGAVE